MKGHGRLLRGLTPPDLVDEVLGKRLERLGEQQPLDELDVELRKVKRLSSVAWALIAGNVVALVLLVGGHLLLR